MNMFGTQTRLFDFVVCALLCVATVLGADDYSILTANFVEYREDKPNSYASGKLYYLYYKSDPEKCRLRFEYDLPGGVKVANLYDYSANAIYSMCSVCTGLHSSEAPDPWYYDTSVYEATNDKEGSYVWYKRKAGTNPQVAKILMANTQSANTGVSKIVFADGRNLTLSSVALNPSTPKKDDALFSKNANCPKPTCPIYADLIFVLDNSNSVSDKSWRDGGNFVNAVMESFTFGDDAVEAAIIQFNAPPAYPCSKRTVDGCSKCYNDYTFVGGYEYPGYATAEIVAGLSTNSGLTVSPDRDALEHVMNGSRPKRSGQTCQGYGLELAMAVIDRSPRRGYSKKPQSIVIAVTDGADWCPNRTEAAADKLRSQYGAFVAEVGVGLESGCNGYDKNYLKRIASKIGGPDNPAYYDVSNYAAIHTVTEQLFKPICDDFNTECGPDCHGFCGCGQCFCPTCTSTGSTCLNNTCVADGKSSTGCVINDIPCPIKDDVCTSYICHGDKQGNDRCTPKYNDCAKMNQDYPQTCRQVLCDPTVTGGCYLKLDDGYCQREFSNACEEFECTPVGQESSSTAYDKQSGCRLKNGGNKTLILENELKKNGKSACFQAKCDKSKGVYEDDLCPSWEPFPKCFTSTCKQSGSAWGCSQAEYNRPTETECVKYKCSSDKTKGWVVDEDESLDEDKCAAKYTDEELKCKNVFCDPNAGCKLEAINGCSSQCTPEQTTYCISEGYKLSSTEHCVLGSCIVILDDVTVYKLSCSYNASVANCYETMAQVVADLNRADPSVCFTPSCGINGRCTYESVAVPTHFPVTECMEYRCVEQGDGSWDWEYLPTAVNDTCKTDDCTFRECRVGEGCHEEDICRNQTTECATFTCDVSGGGAKCVYVNTTMKETECTKEVCLDGKIVLTTKDLIKSCTNAPDKCYYPICVDGMCQYERTPPPGDDPCTIYTCDPETGVFSTKEKCNDGLYCTEDFCTVFGECKFTPITCSGELDMTNYPCFVPYCREGEGEHKCIRKILRNAYVDVCGECIIEEENSESESGSYFAPKSTSVDVLECTNAPPKPVLTEGLAAASIALIVLAAIIIGAAVAASGVAGTKALLDRAKGADNQCAHTNPLFEVSDTEMSNPAYTGD